MTITLRTFVTEGFALVIWSLCSPTVAVCLKIGEGPSATPLSNTASHAGKQMIDSCPWSPPAAAATGGAGAVRWGPGRGAGGGVTGRGVPGRGGSVAIGRGATSFAAGADEAAAMVGAGVVTGACGAGST